VTDSLTWVKSSYSGSQGGNCVEVAALPDGRSAVRDSKRADEPMLTLAAADWNAFLRHAKQGGFDPAA
jgi:Domain of unknown function (DUF397)